MTSIESAADRELRAGRRRPSSMRVRRSCIALAASVVLIGACTGDDTLRSVDESTPPSAAPDGTDATDDAPGESTPSPSAPAVTEPAPSAPETTPPTTAPPESSAPVTTTRPTTTGPLVATPLVPITAEPPAGGFTLDPASTLVRDAIADLAERLGVSTDEVVVTDAQLVTWGDSSLGCPQPGMEYLQRLVDGSLVVLEVGGRSYEYHGGVPLTLCEQPKSPAVTD